MAHPTGQRPWAKQGYRSLLALGLVALAAFVGGLLLGLNSTAPQAVAAPPPPAETAPLGPAPSPDYQRRVVARIYGTEDITREDLGEYLIARSGAESLDLLINRRIIERACREKGIQVNAAEVEASLDEDCRGLSVDRKTFVANVLKHYKKTLYEWKEDVIRPRLLLAKLSRERVQVSEDDIRKAYEANYGEKVEVRILLYPSNDQKVVYKIYEQVRKSDEEFDRAARIQPSSQLAMTGGAIKPICHYSGDDEKIEKTAFSLQPGEISEVLKTPEGLLIMKCVKRHPPDRTKVLENERAALTKLVEDRKLQQEIAKVFEEVKKVAQPVRYLEKSVTEAELKCSVQQEIMQLRSPNKSQSGN